MNLNYFIVFSVRRTPDTNEANIKYTAFRNSICKPFVINADFESLLKLIDIHNKTTYQTLNHEIFAGRRKCLE
ncbi:hypothetical protein NL526_29795, partial [Klebsiella pneumoniae]|nr:hypothetical protein [Klebsiella pneumoniae]